VGPERALNALGLQTLLMSGVRDFREHGGVARHEAKVLAAAASLDYVLMLATQTAHAPIPAQESDNAIRAGIARAVDDALLLLRAIAGANDGGARTFVRNGLPTVKAAMDAEGLTCDDRRFALIALAADVSA
jgi:hypothetical protein